MNPLNNPELRAIRSDDADDAYLLLAISRVPKEEQVSAYFAWYNLLIGEEVLKRTDGLRRYGWNKMLPWVYR